VTCSKPLRKDDQVQQELRYYSPEIHKAAFVLPVFANKAIRETREEHKKSLQETDSSGDKTEKDSNQPTTDAQPEGESVAKKGKNKGKRKKRT